MPVEARLVGQWERGVRALAQRQRQLIVLFQSLVDLALLRSYDGTVLGGKPGSLDISRLLRIGVDVDLARKAGDALDALPIHRPDLVQTSLLLLREGERLLGLDRIRLLLNAEEGARGSFLEDFVVVLRVHVDDGSESVLRAFDRPVDQGKLGNVVLVDHAENRSREIALLLGVAQLEFVRRPRLVEAVGRNQLRGVMFGDAI